MSEFKPDAHQLRAVREFVRGSASARFWAKVNKTDTCWHWTAGCNPKGYGKFWCNGATVSAHRYSYELENGPVPDGLDLLHSCDNKKCVRPSHLLPGTNAQNAADRKLRGRYAKGENHCNAVLSNAEVEIVKMLIDLGMPMVVIAKTRNINYSTVANIKYGNCHV